MRELANINTIKDILARHGFKFSKSMGQNFLINPGICPKMAEASELTKNKGVLEIGPGIGVLTCELAKLAGKVVCVELDKRLLPVLEETLSEFDNVEVVNDDILKVDLKKLIAERFATDEICVCANLPYYITSPVIMNLLESGLDIESIVVMVQKEAAVRICAAPGTRESGAISLAVNYYAEPKLLFNVSRGSFMPAPNVDSAVLKLKIRKEPAVKVDDEELLFRTIKAAFGKRRKTLINALSGGLSMAKSEVSDILKEADMKPTVRAEELTLNDFGKIVNIMKARQ